MAKKPGKETSVPLILALVFFVLTTIAFGVLWYMQYSEQQAKEDAKAKAEKEATVAKGLTADAQLEAMILRILVGVEEEKDKETIASETKNKAKIAASLKKIRDSMAKAVGKDDASKLPEELNIWPLDDSGNAGPPPAKGFLPVIGDAIAKRDSAVEASAKARKDYEEAVKTIKSAVTDIDQIKKKFEEVAAALPKKFQSDLKELTTKFDDRTKKYIENEAKARDEFTKIEDEKQKVDRVNKDLVKDVMKAQAEIVYLTKQLVKKQDTFQYDEPQGKILRRLSQDVVEIDLGSDALVRPGLTFTVLPSDYPEKGRQSRIREFREKNDRGEYKAIQRFVEKATLEVIEVVGPKRSRARITSENEPIRDAIGPGDLLYNAAWRKGAADHIALIGIFDVNGDGTDDIEAVVRDLLKMGIPVDAYYDLKTRKWKGTIDSQTRFIIQGYYPIVNGASDPLVGEKSKLRGAITDAIEFAQSKGGAQTVGFRDFFPRMGYKVKMDVSSEKINQAAGPYLKGVNTVETPPMQ
jgi:hypothetical protein